MIVILLHNSITNGKTEKLFQFSRKHSSLFSTKDLDITHSLDKMAFSDKLLVGGF